MFLGAWGALNFKLSGQGRIFWEYDIWAETQGRGFQQRVCGKLEQRVDCIKTIQWRVSKGQSRFSACCWCRQCGIWGRACEVVRAEFSGQSSQGESGLSLWIMSPFPHTHADALAPGYFKLYPLHWCSGAGFFFCRFFHQISFPCCCPFCLLFVLPKPWAYHWIPYSSLPLESQVVAITCPLGFSLHYSFFLAIPPDSSWQRDRGCSASSLSPWSYSCCDSRESRLWATVWLWWKGLVAWEGTEVRPWLHFLLPKC